MKENLFREFFSYKDSNCFIISDKIDGVDVAKESIIRNRRLLDEYIASHQKFVYTLKPISVPSEPLVANLMAQAGEKAGVGPMAAVAGVLADLAVNEMCFSGCKVAVVENGGEVSATSNVPIDVALAAGNEPLSKRLGFRLTDFPIGVATSSGRFSHALSFGDAEAVTVFCQEAGLADAAATAICNVVKGEDSEDGINIGIETAKSIHQVEGAMILYKGNVGYWGKIPQIIRVHPSPNL